MANVTMEDVAKEAGVSLKTVSRVVNNEPNVTPTTKDLVLQTIAGLGFVPNIAARRLSRGKAMAIGLVLGWPVKSTYASALIDFVLKSSNSEGYGLSLFSLDENSFGQVVQACLGKQIDGVIMDTVAGLNEDLKKQLDAFNIPTVIIHPDNMDDAHKTSYVTINDKQSAKEAVEYLIELGHQDIGYVCEITNLIQEEARLSGYREALAEAGIPFQEALVSESSLHSFHAGFAAVSQLIATNNVFTALFCSTDEIAMGAMSAIWQAGLKVPDDISVIGFDDIRYAKMVVPPLTTVQQPIDEIAQVAVKHLIDVITDPAAKSICTILPTRLVVRETSKPLQKSSGI